MVATVKRVRRLTAEGLNQARQTEAEARVAYCAAHPEEIEGRLRELDEEWDIERAIELEAAGTVLTGFLLGAVFSRKWFLLPVLASSMLLLHNIQGGYPLLSLFRRVGLRTTNEIDQERYALKALRGDFAAVRQSNGRERTRAALEAAHPTGSASEAITPAI
jgi:hypothetical protein